MKSMNDHIIALATEACDPRNPLCGVKPNLGVFGGSLKGKISLLLGGIWALVLVAIAISFLLGLGKWGWAKMRSHDPDDLGSGAERMKKAGAAFGATVMAGTILTGIIAFAA